MISIMIVDDEPLVRASIQSFLNWEEYGYTFSCEASNGEEALIEMNCHPVDIILLDIYMPKMNGLEFLEKLQSVNDAPIVLVLSANDHYSSVRKAFQLGALDYILKSDLDEKTLLDILDRKKDSLASAKNNTGLLNVKDLNYLKQVLLFDLFYNRNPEYTDNLLREIGINLKFPIKIGFLWHRDKIEENACEMIGLQIAQFFKRRKEQGPYAISEDGSILFIYKVSSDQIEDVLCRDFAEIIRNSMDISLDYAQSEICHRITDIPDQYKYVLSLQTMESRIVRKAKEYIRQHFSSSELSLEEVSRFVEISKAHLSSRFSIETGQTFRDFLTKVRIDEAKKLLQVTNLKVYQISEQIGYLNVEHFSRIFKKTTGITPNRYSREKKYYPAKDQ